MLTTCAQKFENRGNAWISPRDQAEMQAVPDEPGSVTRFDWERRERLSVRYADAPLTWVQVQRIARTLTPEEAQQKRQRDNMLGIRQLVGGHERTDVPLGPKALGLLNRVYHPMNEELNPFDRDFEADERRWREFVASEKARIAKS